MYDLIMANLMRSSIIAILIPIFVLIVPVLIKIIKNRRKKNVGINWNGINWNEKLFDYFITTFITIISLVIALCLTNINDNNQNIQKTKSILNTFINQYEAVVERIEELLENSKTNESFHGSNGINIRSIKYIKPAYSFDTLISEPVMYNIHPLTNKFLVDFNNYISDKVEELESAKTTSDFTQGLTSINRFVQSCIEILKFEVENINVNDDIWEENFQNEYKKTYSEYNEELWKELIENPSQKPEIDVSVENNSIKEKSLIRLTIGQELLITGKHDEGIIELQYTIGDSLTQRVSGPEAKIIVTDYFAKTTNSLELRVVAISAKSFTTSRIYTYTLQITSSNSYKKPILQLENDGKKLLPSSVANNAYAIINNYQIVISVLSNDDIAEIRYSIAGESTEIIEQDTANVEIPKSYNGSIVLEVHAISNAPQVSSFDTYIVKLE